MTTNLNLTEAQFQLQVLELCWYRRLLAYHTHDSRRSQPGFPDLVIVGRRTIFRELKTDKGRVSTEQQDWLDRLTASGQSAAVWRPRDLPLIQRTLQELAA